MLAIKISMLFEFGITQIGHRGFRWDRPPDRVHQDFERCHGLFVFLASGKRQGGWRGVAGGGGVV